MSRLDAALRRAAGAVQDPEPVPPAVPPVFANEDFDPAGEHQIEADESDADTTTLARQNRSSRVREDNIFELPSDGAHEPELDPKDEPSVHAFNSRHLEKLVVSPKLPPALREQYRRLGATLHHAQTESGLKTLMITSAVPEEGKTLTAANIALTLSESYQRRVLLIDADLRRPSLDDIFEIPKVFGLSELLTTSPERTASLIQVSNHLSLLPAGAPDSDPMSKLTSDRMRRLIEEASSSFEWVIIDTPPVGILTDAKLLGSMVDAALVVIRAGKTPAALVQRAVESLGRNRILGVVLNRVEMQAEHGGEAYYGAYYYTTGRRR
jgi:capsular exopolysaccharide synthesis family protein